MSDDETFEATDSGDSLVTRLTVNGILPCGACVGTDGRMALHGVSLSSLGDTPLYVYDVDTIHHQLLSLRRGLEGIADYSLHYACKASLCIKLAQLLRRLDMHFDAVSGGEISILLSAGVTPDRMSLHGNAKSNSELATCVSLGITVNIDSEYELERLVLIASSSSSTKKTITPVFIRVIPSVDAHTHASIATGGATSKFGVSPCVAQSMARRIAEGHSDTLRFMGYHAHCGSQIFTPEDHEAQLDVMLDLVQSSPAKVHALNLGGGFGVRYVVPETPDRVTLEEYMRRMATRFLSGCASRGISPPPHLVFEPGRCIVARAGVTLYSVVGTKRDGREWIVDGGMGDNLRVALYGARYTVLCEDMRRPHNTATDVVGRFCESGDVVGRDLLLPKRSKVGDRVMVCTTGAYHHAMNTCYNAVPRPGVVAVASDAPPEVWVRPETYEDLLRRDVTAQLT